jgi:hypothetical protein
VGASGTAVVDFGAFPGTTDAAVVITGETGILNGSLVEAWLRPIATAEHSEDEHVMASVMLDIVACEIVAGVGFTIRAVARDLGGGALMSPGQGRQQNANATVLQNQGWADQTRSVGGQCLNLIWGTFTVAWVWN